MSFSKPRLRYLRLWMAACGLIMLVAYGSGIPTSRISVPASSGSGQGYQARSGTTLVAFHPDGRKFANVSADGAVLLRDVATGQVRKILREPSGAAITAIAFGPDGQTLATIGEDAQILLWDIATGEQRAALAAHLGAAVTGIAFSPDGIVLASTGKDMTARLWDIRNGELLRIFGNSSGTLDSVAFSLDGRLYF
jgi:WD40 repeat protein